MEWRFLSSSHFYPLSPLPNSSLNQNGGEGGVERRPSFARKSYKTMALGIWREETVLGNENRGLVNKCIHVWRRLDSDSQIWRNQRGPELLREL